MTLDELNDLPEEELRRQLHACCGSRRWVENVAFERPFDDIEALHRAADRASDSLGRRDWLEAFGHHPRIGDVESLRRRFGARSGGWSEGEQAGALGADDSVLGRLAEGNRQYEERFGYLFIVFATGKSADEMLELLEARLGNDAGTELRIAAAEQRKITRLRLDKLLSDAG